MNGKIAIFTCRNKLCGMKDHDTDNWSNEFDSDIAPFGVENDTANSAWTFRIPFGVPQKLKFYSLTYGIRTKFWFYSPIVFE